MGPAYFRRQRFSGLVGLAMLAGLSAAGACSKPREPVGTPVEEAWESPSPPAPPVISEVTYEHPAPATSPAAAISPSSSPPPAVVAVVNGRQVSRDQLIDLLIDSRGLALLEQLILLAAAEERLDKMGLAVAPADLAAANDDALRQIAQPVGGDGTALDRPTAERLLGEFLAAKNLSKAEWGLRMRQRATIHKIAAAEVGRMAVTDVMLREEYALAYGERAQVRHIQVSSMATAERVRAAISAGKDFEAVARDMSENQITGSGGGLLPPFTRNDGAVPPMIREMAFRMEPGEISSALHQDNWYHLLKLERRFPASNVAFENADRDALRARLLDRLTRQRQDELEEELFRTAAVDVRDDVLRRQFRAKYRR